MSCDSSFAIGRLWRSQSAACADAGGLRARDFAVGFRAAIAIELPGRAHFLDFIEIEIGDEQFVLVAAGLRDDFAARIAEITLAVKFADFPGLLRCPRD